MTVSPDPGHGLLAAVRVLACSLPFEGAGGALRAQARPRSRFFFLFFFLFLLCFCVFCRFCARARSSRAPGRDPAPGLVICAKDVRDHGSGRWTA